MQHDVGRQTGGLTGGRSDRRAISDHRGKNKKSKVMFAENTHAVVEEGDHLLLRALVSGDRVRPIQDTLSTIR